MDVGTLNGVYPSIPSAFVCEKVSTKTTHLIGVRK